jgi:hypothetical protein
MRVPISLNLQADVLYYKNFIHGASHSSTITANRIWLNVESVLVFLEPVCCDGNLFSYSH